MFLNGILSYWDWYEKEIKIMEYRKMYDTELCNKMVHTFAMIGWVLFFPNSYNGIV